MTFTVKTPRIVPIAPFWFENLQIASKWYPAPGPQWPRGSQ